MILYGNHDDVTPVTMTQGQLNAWTKAQAHEIIDSLKAGTYDPAKWTVPF